MITNIYFLYFRAVEMFTFIIFEGLFTFLYIPLLYFALLYSVSLYVPKTSAQYCIFSQSKGTKFSVPVLVVGVVPSSGTPLPEYSGPFLKRISSS